MAEKIIEIRNDTELAKLDVNDKRFKNKDTVGKVVLERLRQSAMHRNTTMSGRFTLAQTLRNCYNQKNSIMSVEDQRLVDTIGKEAYVNLTELKTSAAEGIFKDNIIAPGSLPFLVEPTPLPSLSEKGKREAVKRLIEIAVQSGVPVDRDTLVEYAATAKKELLQQEKDIAEEKAKNMNELIKDQCEEGGYQEAMLEFIQDFVLYPYAVMEGPIATLKEVDYWNKNKFDTRIEETYTFRRVSPFDLYWTPDSTSTQDGTGVTIVERMPIHALSQMLQHESFLKENVNKVLDSLKQDVFGTSWLIKSSSINSLMLNTSNAEAKNTHGMLGGGTVEVLRHYGVFSGAMLNEMGVKKVGKQKKGEELYDESRYYECTAIVIGGITVQIAVSKTTGVYKRPVNTASYERRGNAIPGVALAQKLYDIERLYLSALRNLVDNMSYASKPITEMDIGRLMKNISVESVLSLRPGQVIPFDSKNTMLGQYPALRFYDIPSHMSEYANLLQQFMDLADRVTQIPAAMHGEPVGTGANRTFRGVALLQGNVLKTIQTSTMNIDKYIHQPMGEILYRYNMMYEDDDSIKGDAQVVAKGASTMLDKQVQAQKISDALMLVGNTGVGTPQLINFLVGKLLEDIDIPQHILNTMMAPDTIQGNTPPPEEQSDAAMLEAAGVAPQGAQSVESSIEMVEPESEAI